MTAREAILARVRELPTLSASALRLGELAQDGRSSAADFEHAIRPDPALTANLLRFANVAYFGLRSRAESVKQAVTLLGVKRVSEIAAAAALAPVIPPRLGGYGVSASEFWLHCVAVAVLTERLTDELGLLRSERLFTAAVLHDVGKLAIGTSVELASGEILGRVRRDGEPLVAAERAVLGLDHGEVGGLVAEAWRLPTVAGTVARWHHAPGDAPPSADGGTIDIVHVADALAHSMGFGADAAELARAVDPGAEARLGIRPRSLERVASASVEEIHQLAALFGAPPGGRP